LGEAENIVGVAAAGPAHTWTPRLRDIQSLALTLNQPVALYGV
jgi:hypothetical protein